MNVLVDLHAKQRLQTQIFQGKEITSSMYFGEGWSCWLGDTKIEDLVHQDIKFWIYRRRARWYWSYKEYISFEQFDVIDWYTVGQVLDLKPQLYRLWFAKHHADWCGCGKNMKRWGFWDSDRCPCCLTEAEQDSTHIFHCTMPEMVKFRSELYSEVAQWMESVSTHPQLQDMLIKALAGDPISFPEGNYTDWSMIQRHLCTIPQIHLMQGFIPIGLSDLQQSYYTQIGSLRKGSTWARQLCEKLMDATHS